MLFLVALGIKLNFMPKENCEIISNITRLEWLLCTKVIFLTLKFLLLKANCYALLLLCRYIIVMN